MKKTVSLLLLFAVLLALFCACKKNGETQPTSSSEPTTWGLILDELPDIGKYKSADSPRMFDKYVDNLIPRSDYGELVPYLGSVVQYETAEVEDVYMSEMIRGYYGLCTVDGVIVTDPVYDSIEYCDGYYLLGKNHSGDDTETSETFLIPKDGSSIFEFPKNKSVSYRGDGIFSCCEASYGAVDSDTSYYSAAGKYLFTADESSSVSEFVNGTALLYAYGSDFKLEYYIINKSGKRIKKFEYGVAGAASTAPGEFVVYGADGKCGLYRGEKQILPCEYDSVCSDDYGNIFAVKNKTVTVFDENKKVKTTFDISGNFNAKRINLDGDLISVGDRNMVYNFTGASRQCDYADELGNGLYLLHIGRKQTVVDKNLKTVCDVPEDGRPQAFFASEKYIPCLFNDDGSGYYYRLLDKNSGKLSAEEYPELLNRKYLLKKNEDGSGFSVVAPDDLSVVRTYDTFIDSVETSRGTLYVYDCDGYVWTVDSDWNVLCRTTMNLTD